MTKKPPTPTSATIVQALVNLEKRDGCILLPQFSGFVSGAPLSSVASLINMLHDFPARIAWLPQRPLLVGPQAGVFLVCRPVSPITAADPVQRRTLESWARCSSPKVQIDACGEDIKPGLTQTAIPGAEGSGFHLSARYPDSAGKYFPPGCRKAILVTAQRQFRRIRGFRRDKRVTSGARVFIGVLLGK